MSNGDNKRKPKPVGELRSKYSDTSVRLNLRVEPAERESFKKVQELLKLFAGGRRITASILIRRMLNLYTAHLLDIDIKVSQLIESGHMKESDRQEALKKAMAPEIAALMRAGGHKVKV